MAVVGIVIAAHNEEAALPHLLDHLTPLAGQAQVVVVCNGCTDLTARRVEEVAPWVRLVELQAASKPLALRAGDLAIDAFPRLYLDADVGLDPAGVLRLAEVMESEDLLAIAPTPRYDFDDANWILRSHYRVWTALQAPIDAVYGTGAIMVSAEGRARFGEWPDVIADDFFLDRMFGNEDKRRLRDVEVVVRLPRELGSCVSRRARVHEGKRAVLRGGLVAGSDPVRAQGWSLPGLLRSQPRLLRDVPAHLTITVAGRMLAAWRRLRGTADVFYRDGSSRAEPGR